MDKTQEVIRTLKYIKDKYSVDYEITRDLQEIKFVKLKSENTKQARVLLRRINLALTAGFGIHVLLDLKQ